uniref:C-type lectin domain-containing protein n=1 Tax=Sinocyclocheilus grahami TaxID=75366 RepID=A0A672Q0G4_SINGR
MKIRLCFTHLQGILGVYDFLLSDESSRSYIWSPYRTYQYMNESMTWQDAQSYCRARFTDLATADTMKDVNSLVNIVDPGYSGSVWIGLHTGTEHRWLWSMGEGTISNYSIWNPGEPSGDGECVRSFNGSWYDESCSTVFPFVCFNDSKNIT